MDAFTEILNIKWWQGFLSGVACAFYVVMLIVYQRTKNDGKLRR